MVWSVVGIGVENYVEFATEYSVPCVDRSKCAGALFLVVCSVSA